MRYLRATAFIVHVVFFNVSAGRLLPYATPPYFPTAPQFFQQASSSLRQPAVGVPPDPFIGTAYHSGLVDVARSGGKMFYWYFPFQNGTTSSLGSSSVPFVLWLTGGPGCSSALAALTENGPFTVESNSEVVANPYAWTNVADVVYVDQPLGTGFSVVGDPRNYVTNEVTVALDMREFLLHFLQQYPSLKDRPFFITGESYAGHYIPSVAHSLLENPLPGIQLKGIAIGNGWVDPISQYPAYATFARETNMVGDIGYQLAKQALEECTSLIERQMWPVALVQCNAVITGLLGKRNPYDIRMQCDAPPFCYNMTSLVSFMNDPVVQKALGVQKPWKQCSTVVYAFMLDDWVTELRTKVGEILDKGVHVLVYSGDQDFICNWRGGEAWVKRTQWKHAEEFRATPYKTWVVDGVPMGEEITAANLRFLRLYQAGHMVPMDVPKAALSMLSEFLTVKETGSYNPPKQPADFQEVKNEAFIVYY